MNASGQVGGIVAPVAFRLDQEQSGMEMLERWKDMGLSVGGFLTRMSCILSETGAGFARVVCDIDPGHSNFVGLVHGGVSAALIDMVSGGAVMSLLKPGETLLTADLAMRYLRPVPGDCGHLHAEGRVSYSDGRRAVVDVKVMLADGTVSAMATVGVSIRPPLAVTEPLPLQGQTQL